MSSSLKAWFLLIAIAAALITGGYYIGGRQGFVLGFFLALALWSISYWYGDYRILSTYGGRAIEGQDPWKLEKTVSELALHARIPKPKIVLLDLDVPTALSSGRSWLRGTIYISQGLLRDLNSEEVRAVLAHEIAKIQRLDTFLYGVGSALSGFMIAIARFFDGTFLPGREKTHHVEQLLAPLTSLPLKIFVSPKNYFAADQQAAQILGDPKPLARVLWKLHACAGTRPLSELPAAAPLFIVNPLTSRTFHRYFDRQPPVDQRIERLVGHFPI